MIVRDSLYSALHECNRVFWHISGCKAAENFRCSEDGRGGVGRLVDTEMILGPAVICPLGHNLFLSAIPGSEDDALTRLPKAVIVGLGVDGVDKVDGGAGVDAVRLWDSDGMGAGVADACLPGVEIVHVVV